ncbi:GNAT family N-acetyltransferase [Cognatishimia sp. MH4019]|uniref:GNAT family N-acetyltransferase n=1 Tax=Cognatishimia sp. MH4019 TaxID=2854030 RepID=UPI001CD24FC0|nr:GNAT family N-acyltransferase [Cognatishimia sp. MH4019]
MISLGRGAYKARFTSEAVDVAACQALRHLAFHGSEGRDADPFDATCTHVMVERGETLVACYRLLRLESGREIARSYAAQFYDLGALEAFDGPLVEMGRFCVHPDHPDPDIIRVAWAALTRYVDADGIKMLFGCASFEGTQAADYTDAFAILKARHLAPKRWLPRVKAPNVFRYAKQLRGEANVKSGMLRMPPLLRTYLTMGGWVSDHAVVDTQMNTLHVFTGVEIAAIPPARARLLRAVAT